MAQGEGLTLRVEPPESLPEVGEEFVLNVWVDNPHFLAFDEVRLALAFDPTKTQVFDWDYRNWIQRGVNVFDGHAHDLFPFNVHTRNEVRNSRGRIDYRVSSTRLASLRAKAPQRRVEVPQRRVEAPLEPPLLEPPLPGAFCAPPRPYL